MSRRVTVRLPEGLAAGLDRQARREGKPKSEIVRDALTTVGIRLPASAERFRETLRRATALRAKQAKLADAAALVREGREDLERRDRRMDPARGRPRCKGHRGAPLSRVTRGFQETE